MACHFIVEEHDLIVFSASTSKHIDLVGSERSVGEARDFVRDGLQAVTSPIRLYDVLLLTSELVTNAVVHARTNLHLGVSWDSDNILVTVQDDGPPLDAGPARSTVSLDLEQESGRGMVIVAALADNFGWRLLRDRAGKVMWFVLAIADSGELGDAA